MLFRAGLIESWGRGTLKIIKECDAAGLPVLEYVYSSPDFEVRMTAKTPGKTPDLILAVLKQDASLTIPELNRALSRIYDRVRVSQKDFALLKSLADLPE